MYLVLCVKNNPKQLILANLFNLLINSMLHATKLRHEREDNSPLPIQKEN